MTKGVYVLLTGQIRHPHYIPQTIRTLEKAKCSGLIEDYVISTWIGEVDRFAGMRDLLSDASGIFVEVTEYNANHQPNVLTYNVTLDIRAGWYGSTNVYFGMRQIPEEALVFRSRLDMHLFTMDYFLDVLTFLRGMNFEHNNPNCPLRNKIWTGGLHKMIPFYVDDRHVFGNAQDIENIFHFSTIHDSVAHPYGSFPEIRYFSNPWVSRNKLIMDLIRLDWLRMLQCWLAWDRAKEFFDALCRFPAFRLMWASYYDIVSKYHYIGVPLSPGWQEYDRRVPEPRNGTYLALKPEGDPIYIPDAEYSAEFLEDLEQVRTTSAEAIISSNKYQESFSLLEKRMFELGLAILPQIRVHRGKGRIDADQFDAAKQFPAVERPLPASEHARLHAHGPESIATNKWFTIDCVVSIDEGFKIPRALSGVEGGFAYYWRRKGEQAVFGWESSRKPFRHDMVGVFLDRIDLWSPNNPGAYEIVVDIVYDGVQWLNIGVPHEIEVT